MTFERCNVFDAITMMASRQDIICDTHGNVSMRDDDDHLYIKPSGVQYNAIKEEDICRVSMDSGDVVLPEMEACSTISRSLSIFRILNPSVDTPHHIAIYKTHPSIRAICHTHSPYATAYACTGRLVVVCRMTEHADFFGKNIRILQYSDLMNWGRSTSKCIDDNDRAVLLSHHGVLTFSRKSALEAVELAVAVESVCKKNYLIETLNPHADVLQSAEVKKWHDRYMNGYGQKKK